MMSASSPIDLNAVVIRRFREDDAEPLCEAALESRMELAPWMPWCHDEYGLNDARQWVRSRQQAWKAHIELSFVIDDGQGRFLGTCGLNRFDLPNRTANLGYWVRTHATRQGVATKAGRLLADLAFETTSLHRLEIMVASGNVASQRVAHKMGAKREAVLQERLWYGESPHDAVLFSIMRSSLPITRS